MTEPLLLTASYADQQASWRLDGESATLGRSSRNTIAIPDTTVSKEHAEIVRRGAAWFVRDLGSRNGTRLNGVEVREAVELRNGDRLEVGNVLVRVGSDVTSAEVRFSEHTVVGSSIRLRADQLLDRRKESGAWSSPVMRLLAEAGHLLVLPRPMRETCDEILKLAEKAIPGSRHLLLLRETEGADPVVMSSRMVGGGADRPLALSRAIVSSVMDDCTSVLTGDALSDPRFMGQQSIVAQSVHSAMAVPLFDNQRVLGLIYVDTQDLSRRYTEEQLEVLTLLANMAAVKITNARLLDTEQARLRMVHELASATRIQRGLLPIELPQVPGWELDAHLETCFEVGGDLYDFRRRPDGHIVFLIGDVSGKGMGASLLMSSFLASARVLYDTCSDPAELARRLGGIMCQTSDRGLFVTGVVGCLDPATGVARLVNAGHLPTYRLRDGAIETLESTGVPFGVLPEFPYRCDELTLAPGESLVLFTDGIPEAQRGEEFFDEPRLHAALIESAGAPLPEMRAQVLARLREFVGDAPRTDDVTLLMLRRTP